MTTRCKVAASCLMPERRFIVFHVEILFRNGHLSYWGVSAVAETAWVDPRMFDCVWGHVHLQACCIYVSFIAVGTLIRLVLVVLTPVRLGQKVYLKKKKKRFPVMQSVLWDKHWWKCYIFSLDKKKTKFCHTCKFESCVKDFSQPGWVHL